MAASQDPPPRADRRQYLLHRVRSFCRKKDESRYSWLGLPVAKIYPRSKARGLGQPSAFPSDIGASHSSRYSLGLMTFRDANVDVLAPLCNASNTATISTEELERILHNAGAGQLTPPMDLLLSPPPMFPIDRPQKIPNPSTMLFIFDLFSCTVASFLLYFAFLALRARFMHKRRDPEIPRWLAPTGRADSLPTFNELPSRIDEALPEVLRPSKLARYAPVFGQPS